METVNTTARLGALRSLMKSNNVDVYIVPSEDGHQSEYIAGCDARRGLLRLFLCFFVLFCCLVFLGAVGFWGRRR